MWRAIKGSMRYKVILVVLATNFAALAVAGLALVIYDLRTYRSMWVLDLVTQSDILGRASAPAIEFDDPKSAVAYLALLEARPRVSAAAIYDTDGTLFATYARPGSPAVAFPPLPEVDGFRIVGDEIVLFSRIVENNNVLGTVYLRAQYQLFDRLVRYAGILGAVMLLSLLVALMVVIWLQRALTQPILAVTDAARQVMTKRDYSLRVHKTTEDEIGYLVDAFNGMLAEIGHRSEANEASNRKLEHEIGERMRAESELRTLNLELERRVSARTAELQTANDELEAFSYSVSHDLRAPLRAIAGFSNLLIEDHGAELSAEARRKLDVVLSEANRMGALIDDLLAFSRLGRKVMQITDLDMTELAQASWRRLIQHHQGTAAEFRLDPLPPARGDPALIGQVWANLLSNALKFSSKRDAPLVEVGGSVGDDELIYFVRDNGAGFDPRYQSKLFEVFQRLHDASDFPGTGVGLALVQRIVLRHRGRVWAESRPDRGATFYFTLPKEPTDE